MSESFIFFVEWADVLKDYPAEVRLEVYEAIIGYAQSGTLPELKPLAKMAFSFIKNQMDRNRDRYDALVEARREAGRRGASVTNERRTARADEPQTGGKGRQRAAKAAIADFADSEDGKSGKAEMKAAKVAIADFAEIENGKFGKARHNDNDNDNDNEINEQSKIALSKVETFDAADVVAESKKTTVSCDDISQIADYYNAEIVTQGAKLRKCIRLTTARKQHIASRLDEYGMEQVKAMIDRAIASRFLNYEATNAPVDIDWIFRPNNFPKVLEGKFDNRQHTNTNTTHYGNNPNPYGNIAAGEEQRRRDAEAVIDAMLAGDTVE